MVEHRDVAPGVVRVTYGDGSRVYVNHTDALVEADGVRVPARSSVSKGSDPFDTVALIQ